MSKIDDKLNDLLDINTEIDETQKKLPTIFKDPDKRLREADKDATYGREVLYNLVERGQDAVDGILELAKETEHPRTYEVAGQLIKTVGETAEKLLTLQKQIRELEKTDSPQESPGTVNNNLFVGSTAELQKFLKDRMKDG
jgi:tryptophanyl-tRNA synthetase